VAQKIALLLTRRPKLSLQVCGRATRLDFERYRTVLLQKQAAARNTNPAKRAPGEANKTINAAADSKSVPSAAEILRSAKNPLTRLALDRTRAVRNFLLAQDKNLKGRVSECRSAYNPKDRNPPRANVTL